MVSGTLAKLNKDVRLDMSAPPSIKGMELTVRSVTPFAKAKHALLFRAVRPGFYVAVTQKPRANRFHRKTHTLLNDPSGQSKTIAVLHPGSAE
jgi:hypothetical protein